MRDQVFSTGNVEFKERLLDWVTDECGERQIDSLQAIEDMLEVVSHMAMNAHRRDIAIRGIYEQAKREAKEEMLERLR